MDRRINAKSVPPQKSSDADGSKRIVFFHPDLGIGGAERLIVDAAVGLQSLGHNVTIFTSHCDKNHCFDEARDGTLDVRVRGNLFPATFLGRFKILFSILRQISLLIGITRSGELSKLKPTVFFIDQLSAGIPFLRWFWEDTPTLFYCHYPDLLLVQNRQAIYRRIWRLPFDLLESWSTRGADRIVVNSEFTKTVVNDVWPGIGGSRSLGVVYPCVKDQKSEIMGGEKQGTKLWRDKKVILSINRFERKKNIELALRAFAGLSESERQKAVMVIAGGYDLRVGENVSYLKDLEQLAGHLSLKSATIKNVVSIEAISAETQVLFLLSISDEVKQNLLQVSNLLVYTPAGEHFGIVPLEAMRCGIPVLAANTGGPLETIEDGQTGWLRSVDAIADWTRIIRSVLFELTPARIQTIGMNGQRRVKEEFSPARMAKRLDEELNVAIKGPRLPSSELPDLGIAALLYILFLSIIALVIKEGLSPQIAGTKNEFQHYLAGLGLISLCLLAMGVVAWKLRQGESAYA